MEWCGNTIFSPNYDVPTMASKLVIRQTINDWTFIKTLKLESFPYALNSVILVRKCNYNFS